MFFCAGSINKLIFDGMDEVTREELLTCKKRRPKEAHKSIQQFRAKVRFGSLKSVPSIVEVLLDRCGVMSEEAASLCVRRGFVISPEQVSCFPSTIITAAIPIGTPRSPLTM